MIKVKICGITNFKDAIAASDAGADAIGFVFCNSSPRYISPGQAAAIICRLPPFVQTVGLFVDQKLEEVNRIAEQAGVDIIQLHGDESPQYCDKLRHRIIKAFRVKDISSLDQINDYQVSATLLDAWSPTAHGGTGMTFNWELASSIALTSRILLAGGLTPDNVADAVRQVLPYGVDTSSGVELSPGRKDHKMMREFIRAAKSAKELQS